MRLGEGRNQEPVSAHCRIDRVDTPVRLIFALAFLSGDVRQKALSGISWGCVTYVTNGLIALYRAYKQRGGPGPRMQTERYTPLIYLLGGPELDMKLQKIDLMKTTPMARGSVMWIPGEFDIEWYMQYFAPVLIPLVPLAWHDTIRNSARNDVLPQI